MHAADSSPVHGDYYTRPLTLPDDQEIPSRQVAIAVSFAGARRGEFVLAESEVPVPASLNTLNTRWGIFNRAKLINRRTVDYKIQETVVDAWERC